MIKRYKLTDGYENFVFEYDTDFISDNQAQELCEGWFNESLTTEKLKLYGIRLRIHWIDTEGYE